MNQTMLAIAGLGTPELIVIVLVIFLLFGATRLPQLAKALGQSKKAFREGIEEGERDEHKAWKSSLVGPARELNSPAFASVTMSFLSNDQSRFN
jgi:TatA/E family protein of Tat protein translocase